MNKLLLILLILSFEVKVNAQIKNGSIIYGYVSNIPENKEASEYYQKWRLNLIEASAQVDFSLNFNTNESYFFVNSILLKNYSSAEAASEALYVNCRFYNSLPKKKSVSYHNNEILGIYAMNYFQEAKWEISKETKMIDGYLCYKATTLEFNTDGWQEESERKITAWYSPKIPVPYGPDGFNGLPGLILELQTKHHTLFVKKINVNLEKEPEINNLESIRILSMNQKNQLLKKAMSSDEQRIVNEKEDKIAKNKVGQEKVNSVVPR